jgi:hypothetical protein
MSLAADDAVRDALNALADGCRPLPEDRKRIAAMLAEYATAIEAAGFAVKRRSDRLVVTARPEEG